jgi:hypothetical protein
VLFDRTSDLLSSYVSFSGFISADSPLSLLDRIALGVQLLVVDHFPPPCFPDPLSVDAGLHPQFLAVERWLTSELAHEFAELGSRDAHAHASRVGIDKDVEVLVIECHLLVTNKGMEVDTGRTLTVVLNLNPETDVAVSASG